MTLISKITCRRCRGKRQFGLARFDLKFYHQMSLQKQSKEKKRTKNNQMLLVKGRKAINIRYRIKNRIQIRT
jgi:hypothetical protein